MVITKLFFFTHPYYMYNFLNKYDTFVMKTYLQPAIDSVYPTAEFYCSVKNKRVISRRLQIQNQIGKGRTK